MRTVAIVSCMLLSACGFQESETTETNFTGSFYFSCVDGQDCQLVSRTAGAATAEVVLLEANSIFSVDHYIAASSHGSYVVIDTLSKKQIAQYNSYQEFSGNAARIVGMTVTLSPVH